jgi:hypothetical protein
VGGGRLHRRDPLEGEHRHQVAIHHARAPVRRPRSRSASEPSWPRWENRVIAASSWPTIPRPRRPWRRTRAPASVARVVMVGLVVVISGLLRRPVRFPAADRLPPNWSGGKVQSDGEIKDAF